MVGDMTTGSSAKKLILFSIPLLIGQVFQQFYNMVDSIVVGQYVGKEAFAAAADTTRSPPLPPGGSAWFCAVSALRRRFAACAAKRPDAAPRAPAALAAVFAAEDFSPKGQT